MRWGADFFGSMAGRIFAVSVVGAIVSATLGIGIATAKRDADLRRLEIERLVERVEDFYALAGNLPPAIALDMIRRGIPHLRAAEPDAASLGVDRTLTSVLRERLGPETMATAQPVESSFCVRSLPPTDQFASVRYSANFKCWVVGLRLKNGQPLRLMYVERRALEGGALAADSIYYLVLILGVGAAALFAAHLAAAPLHALSEAATALGDDLERSPMPESGPSEVRNAARAFNSMQAVLRRHLRERQQMLASITHDLQTPMTRLRLRVDKVRDGELRERMVADLAAMQRLIREGLELARGDETAEPAVRFDLGSLLESIAADASDAGHEVRTHGGAGLAITARPFGLKRAISNLVQNALNYAGSAELLAVRDDDSLMIVVRDRGAGIPPPHLDGVLEPFVRLESSRSRETGGTGLGLTIARRLVERDGGSLKLVNRPEGGLDAVVTLPMQILDASGPAAPTAAALPGPAYETEQMPVS
jgi:signal transduction histidine kinase